MADLRLEDTACTLHATLTVAGSSSISTLGPTTKLLSSDASAMARFSLDLRELEAVNALNTMSEVYETQMLDTQAIMHELSTDSEVTFRRDIVSAEILPSRPGIDPFENTRPNCSQPICHYNAAVAYADWAGASVFLLHLRLTAYTWVNNITLHARP